MTGASIREESPSVHAHLSLLQSVIQRMAANSASCKAWCITLVSAVLVVVADKGKPEFAWIAVLPTLLFFWLDAYYLALEKGFRQAYNSFIDKLHADGVNAADLYVIDASGGASAHFLDAARSASTWPFYGVLLGMIYVAYQFVL